MGHYISTIFQLHGVQQDHSLRHRSGPAKRHLHTCIPALEIAKALNTDPALTNSIHSVGRVLVGMVPAIVTALA